MYVRWRTGYVTQPWVLFLIPGLGLIVMALAILVWPQLLAYMIALAMLAGGIGLTGWALAMRRAHKQPRRHDVHETTHYEVLQ